LLAADVPAEHRAPTQSPATMRATFGKHWHVSRL
jgi:hypothetical protein